MTPRTQTAFGLVISLVIFFAIAMAVADTAAWQETMVGGAEDVDAIVVDLFEQHVVAFEILGVLLTAAMIGALVIARPMGLPLDRSAYTTVDEDTLAQTMRVSDVGARFATPAPLAPSAPASPPPLGGAPLPPDQERPGLPGGEEE